MFAQRFETEHGTDENHENEYMVQRGKIVKLDSSNEFMMDLIRDNLNVLLENSDYTCKKNSKIIDILFDDPLGFIVINYDEIKEKSTLKA